VGRAPSNIKIKTTIKIVPNMVLLLFTRECTARRMHSAAVPISTLRLRFEKQILLQLNLVPHQL
jgi:hypothetical protein